MSKDNIRAGGFCAVNGGKINDCYSLVRIRAGKKTAGGFFGENNGSVSKSFHIWLLIPQYI